MIVAFQRSGRLPGFEKDPRERTAAVRRDCVFPAAIRRRHDEIRRIEDEQKTGHFFV